MEVKKRFISPYVLISALISVTALAMVLLTLLLLPRTDEIMAVMQWRMVNAKSFRVETDFEYRGWMMKEDADREREEVTFKTAGSVDRSDRANAVQRQMFKISIAPPADQAQNNLNFDGELRSLEGTNFLRLNRVPQNFGGIRLDRFMGRWLEVDLSETLDSFDLPVLSGRRNLSEADQLYLIEQFRITPFLTVNQRLGDEVIGGVDTMHYEVLPEVLFIKDYFITTETVRKGRELNDEERQEIDRLFASLTAEPSEVWIGQGDYYLYRALLRFRYDDGEREATINLTLRFSNFNAPVTVENPTDEPVDNVSDIVKSFLPSLVERLPSAGLGGQTVIESGELTNDGLTIEVPGGEPDEDPDEDGLVNVLEYFYGSDPFNPDTDGDGMNDGDEVEKGRNPTGRGELFDFGLKEAFGGEVNEE